VSISRVKDAFTAEGHLKDPDHEARLIGLGHEVAHYARLHFGLG
jgi:hypothetical protein